MSKITKTLFSLIFAFVFSGAAMAQGKVIKAAEGQFLVLLPLVILYVILMLLSNLSIRRGSDPGGGAIAAAFAAFASTAFAFAFASTASTAFAFAAAAAFAASATAFAAAAFAFTYTASPRSAADLKMSNWSTIVGVVAMMVLVVIGLAS